MNNNESKPDFYSGIPWVYVSPEQARGHPKGQLNLILWLIVAYFVVIGFVKMGFMLAFGAGVLAAFLSGIWPLLTGLGLAMRVPWSIFMASVSAGLTVYALLRGFGSDGSFVIMLETVANAGILFYLIDGDRPNFIYRHRYRKYSAERGQDGDD